MFKKFVLLLVLCLIGCKAQIQGQGTKTVTYYDNGNVIKVWEVNTGISYFGEKCSFRDNNGKYVELSGHYIIEEK